MTITIPVPSGSKSRDLIVDIKKKGIKVGLKGAALILEGELCKEVKVDDSTWTLGEFKEYARWMYRQNVQLTLYYYLLDRTSLTSLSILLITARYF